MEGSFETILESAGIEDFRFHDLRHTFASWYMMNGGDLYELAKILGHSNIKMTERYAKLAQDSTLPRPAARRARCGRLMEARNAEQRRERLEMFPYCSARLKPYVSGCC